MGQTRLTKVTIVNFPKKNASDQLYKNYAALYFVIHVNDFFLNIVVLWWGIWSRQKYQSIFEKKSHLGISAWFVSNLAQNFNTLYHMICQYFFETW